MPSGVVGFEQRMRERRAATCVDRARAALRAGRDEEAREYLEEARSLGSADDSVPVLLEELAVRQARRGDVSSPRPPTSSESASATAAAGSTMNASPQRLEPAAVEPPARTAYAPWRARLGAASHWIALSVALAVLAILSITWPTGSRPPVGSLPDLLGPPAESASPGQNQPAPTPRADQVPPLERDHPVPLPTTVVPEPRPPMVAEAAGSAFSAAISGGAAGSIAAGTARHQSDTDVLPSAPGPASIQATIGSTGGLRAVGTSGQSVEPTGRAAARSAPPDVVRPAELVTPTPVLQPQADEPAATLGTAAPAPTPAPANNGGTAAVAPVSNVAKATAGNPDDAVTSPARAPSTFPADTPANPPAQPHFAAAPDSTAAGAASGSMAGEQAVRSTLDRYAAAYNRLDADATRQVWPGVDERGLRRAFSGLLWQRIRFDACDVRVGENRATAKCRGLASYAVKVGNHEARAEPREWHFELRRGAADGVWQIDSARAK